MAGKSGTLTVRVISDTKAAEQGIERFGKKVDSTGDKMEKAGRKMTLFATVPVAAAMGLATNAASDLEQAMGGTEAVFGEARDTIDEYADSAAKAMGLSEREFREATTSIGGQLKRMTGDVDLAAERSVELAQVAADLAATYGGTTAEAVQALGSAFRGEADPAERFNLNLKQGAVNAKAVELGLAASTSEVDENAKAQATLALIMEQSADAQGQFARENDSAAGSMQIARAEVENAAAAIGSALLPMVSKAAGGVADVAAAFSDLPKPIQNSVLALAGVVAAAGPVLSVGGKLVNNAQRIGRGFDKLATGAYTAAGSLGPLTAGLGVALVALYAWQDGKNKARQRTEEFIDAIEADTGALGENTEALILNRLEQRDQTDDLARAGVSFDELTAAVEGNDEARGALIEKLKQEGELNFGLAKTLGELFGAYDKSIDQQEQRNEIGAKGAAVTEDLTKTSADLEDQMSDEEAQADRLNSAIDSLADAKDRLIGVNISAQEATRRAEQAHADLTETLRENGATLDIHSEKGRANQDAIDDVANAALEHVEALKKQGASTDDVNFFLTTHVERLKDTMRQAGLTEDEIAGYIETLGLTPENIATLVELNGVVEAEAALSDLTRPRVVEISGRTTVVGGGIRAFHTGGYFHAPPGSGGEGLALLRDGERVLTPQQARMRDGARSTTVARSGPNIEIHELHVHNPVGLPTEQSIDLELRSLMLRSM